MTGEETIPRCPGCHFRCRLDRYQCGRGRKIHARWQETGEVPERKPGPPAGQEPDVAQRLAFGLNILANVLQEKRTRRAEGEILGALMGHGGLASRQLLASRARIDSAKFDSALDALVADGLVERSNYGHIADAVQLTDAGRAKMPEVEAERDAANEEFLAPLSEEERAQFAGLVFKLLAPGRKH